MNAPAPHQPSYFEWLAQLDLDEVRDRLFTLANFAYPPRMANYATPLDYDGTAPRFPTHAHALVFLTKLQLLVLQHIQELCWDAEMEQPTTTTLETLHHSIAELHHEYPHVAEQLPTPAQVTTAVQQLRHFHLISTDVPTPSDGTQIIGITEDLFDNLFLSSPLLWALSIDMEDTRSPAVLRETINSLDNRSASHLQLVHEHAGLGYSNRMQELPPEHPIQQLLTKQLFYLVDGQTIRLNERVARILTGAYVPPAGGLYAHPTAHTPSIPLSPSPERTSLSSAADRAIAQEPQFQQWISSHIQRILDLRTTLAFTAEQPLKSLAKGGVGVREVSTLAKRANLSADIATEHLATLHQLGFINTAEPVSSFSFEHLCSATDSGLDFLDTDMATAWAAQLVGWLRSNIRPRIGSDLNLCHPDDTDSEAALLRASTAPIFAAYPEAATDLDVFHQALARDLPFVSMTVPAHVVEAIHAEALSLGLQWIAPLIADVANRWTLYDPTNELHGNRTAALRETFSTVLQPLLPQPVTYVVVQSDLTILAPGLLTADDTALLAAFADCESPGLASVWRVSAASIHRAIQRGVDSATILDFLHTRSATPIPQALDYLIHDAASAHQQSPQAGASPTGTSHTKPRTEVAERTGPYLTNSDVAAAIEANIDKHIANLTYLRQQASTTQPVATQQATPQIRRVLIQAQQQGHQLNIRHQQDPATVHLATVLMVIGNQITLAITGTDAGAHTETVTWQLKDIYHVEPHKPVD